jgi:hypothetical protein
MPDDLVILKVALQEQKSIWRKIAIRGKQTLDDLHEAIYKAFDRYDEHLYSFYFPKPGSRGRARIRDAAEYACPFAIEEPDPFADHELGDAAETELASLGLKPRRIFYYLFDYGDEWWHEITVETVAATAEKGKYPKILQKNGKSPPQYPGFDDEEDDGDDDGDEDD